MSASGFAWRALVRGLVSAPVVVVGLGLAACSGVASPTVTPRAEEPATSTVIDATGAELYATNCQLCHGDPEGAGTTVGAPPHNEKGHTWHHPDAQLKDWVMNGKLGFGQMPQMPAFQDTLTDPEMDVILTYIKTWWTPDQRDGQADISRRYQEALERQKKDR